VHFETTRPVAAFPTMLMILLRECRQERGYSVEVVADRLKLPASEWEKAEGGKAVFDWGLFHRACDFMAIPPWRVIFIGESYVPALRAAGWDLLFAAPQRADRDALLERANAFWQTQLGQGSWREYPVLDEPNLLMGLATPLFRYVLEPAYRALQDNPPPLNLDLSFSFADQEKQAVS
jgi:hypothetical protein